MTLRNGLFGLTLTSVIALAAFSANAADMYHAPASYKDEPVYEAGPLWTGFYAGVNAGYAWANEDVIPGFQTQGGFVGAQAGYNLQRGRAVIGVEADIQGTGIAAGFTNAAGEVEAVQQVDYFGTLRGRLGYTFDRTLVYATGGLAFGEVKNSLPGLVSKTDTQTGYVLGGGIEYKFAPAWSFKAEYQYINLGSETLTGALLNNEVHLPNKNVDTNLNTVRVGFNYHVGSHDYVPLK
jgi:outer membrane immunogenic protein